MGCACDPPTRPHHPPRSPLVQGELTSSVVNAPMVAPEVLKELQPFVRLAVSHARSWGVQPCVGLIAHSLPLPPRCSLADGLGRAAVQLVEGGSGFSEVAVTYHRCAR